MAELQRHILELNANQKEFTPTKLVESKKTTINEKTVGEFYTEMLLHYRQTNKTGNGLIYKMSYNSLKTFSKGRLNFYLLILILID